MSTKIYFFFNIQSELRGKYGKYKMSYTSMCGEEIQVDSTVDIFIEDTLFDFPEPVINLSGDVREKK